MERITFLILVVLLIGVLPLYAKEEEREIGLGLDEVSFEVIELDKSIWGYIEIAVRNDKDIQRIGMDIQKMAIEIEIAQGRAKRIMDPPTLNINVGAGYSSSIEEKKDFAEGTTLSTGISASYNLWNIIEMMGGEGEVEQAKAKEVEKLNIEIEKLKVEREKREGEVEAAVKKTYSALKNSIFKMEMRKTEASEAKEEYEITKEAYERGAEEVDMVRRDKENYLRKLESFLDAVVSYQFQLAEWERLVGGTE